MPLLIALLFFWIAFSSKIIPIHLSISIRHNLFYSNDNYYSEMKQSLGIISIYYFSDSVLIEISFRSSQQTIQ